MIGRLPENAIQIASPRVSRWHALIYLKPDGGHWLTDLGSSNGVCLNGTRLREPQELADSDQIEIAGRMLTFHSERAGPPRKEKKSQREDWLRQRTEKPSDAFAVREQAAVIIGADNKAQFVSERAASLCNTYLPGAGPSTLPEAVWVWLQSSPTTPFTVAQGYNRLRMTLVDAGAGRRLLLLAEEQQVFAPEQLEQLGLTRREAEVLHWMAEGKTNPEIASILGSSAATVKKQAEHIFAKLGVGNRSSALLRVMELRLAHEPA